MKRIITSIVVLSLLFSFISCNFFTTSWASGLQRDLSSMLKKESTEELAKLAGDSQYNTDPDTAAAILDALGDKDQDEIASLSTSEKEDILDLAITATIPIDLLSDLIDALESDDISVEDLVDLLGDNMTSFDTTAIQTILNDPDDVSTESLVTASAALIAQVLLRETEDLTLEELFTEDEDGNVAFKEIEDLDPQSIADLEAVYNVFQLFQEGGEREDEAVSFFGISLDDLFGDN